MPEPANQVILRTHGLTKRFGGFYALKDLFFEVRSGDIHSVIGPNGAGKTTLFNLLSGTLEPDSGEIVFENRTLGRVKPNGRTMLGIARTFQNIRLFGQMTVLENVMLGRHGRTFPSLWSSFWKTLAHPPFGEADDERPCVLFPGQLCHSLDRVGSGIDGRDGDSHADAKIGGGDADTLLAGVYRQDATAGGLRRHSTYRPGASALCPAPVSRRTPAWLSLYRRRWPYRDDRRHRHRPRGRSRGPGRRR